MSDDTKEYLWWRPATSEIPASPGVYRFRDDEGRVIYVGKAKNLRARLVNYFQAPELLHRRTAQMVATARSVQWTIVATEIEALTLEFQWIKQLDPRFNIMFRDDKSYPYLSVSLGEEFPRVAISRDAKRKGTRYFGPYAQVWAIRETIDHLLNTFPVRTCSAGVFRRAQAQGRPCLLGYIDRCSAPCVGKISPEDHRDLALGLCAFMEGKTKPFITQAEQEMRQAAAIQDYELAAKKRDQLAALEKVQERNTIVLTTDTDADIFALVGDELDVAIHAFYVRGGRVRGTRGWIIERYDNRTDAELLSDLLQQTYFELAERMQVSNLSQRTKSAPVSVDDVAHLPVDAIPGQILVSLEPTDKAFLQTWLGDTRGTKVAVTVPQRGAKVELMDTVAQNARHSLELYKTRRSGDIAARAAALEELQDALNLPQAPLRIECYDISHTAGQHRVASMVVFEDGMPRKDAYRTFNIIGDDANQDDTAAMSEVLIRRFRRLAAETHGEVGEDEEGLQYESGPVDPATNKPRRFAYRPDLLVVDGGLPQVNAARDALADVGVDIPVIGLAKRLEEIWIPDDAFPLILPRSSGSLYLLQYLRDESHRFAITKHRAKRSKSQTKSALDAVAGLGPARQRALLKAFGSVKRIRHAAVDDLAAVPGVGPKLAQIVYDALHVPPDET